MPAHTGKILSEVTLRGVRSGKRTVNVRKDLMIPTSAGPIYGIIKPLTSSGMRAARARQTLLDANGIRSFVHYYNPLDPRWRPGSPTYIGPRGR